MTSEPTSGNATPPGSQRPYCCAMGDGCIRIFKPQPGITGDELAASVELLLFAKAAALGHAPPAACEMLYAAMDEATRRHWVVKKISKIKVAQKPSGLQLPPGAKG